MTRRTYLALYGKDAELTMWTVEDIKKWREKVEAFSGLQCTNLTQLKENATIYDYNHAKEEDCIWFRGYINDLSILVC